MTEGPFFVDEQLNRSDVRSDPATGAVKEGALLTLALYVTRVAAGACAPLPGALVDIWHCDADGLYSDVRDPRSSTVGQQFLRGQQVTDSDGRVEFVTIYPGWYPGRTVHIHFKVRGQADGGGTFDATSQLFFDDALTDAVFERAPYAARGTRTTRNENDGIYGSGGDQLIVAVAPEGEGYQGRFDIGLAL
jgi:protocatechuate 3,4-dioxygenase beta subunit